MHRRAPWFMDQLSLLFAKSTFFGHQCNSIFGMGLMDDGDSSCGSLCESISRVGVGEHGW